MMRQLTAISRLLLLLALAGGSPFCVAQAIGLAPAQIVETFKPGVPFEYELSVANRGSEAAELHARITDLWYNEKNEKTFDAPGTHARSAANWIQFVPERVQVAPGGTQKLKVIITPPAGAKGGYYAVLFVESTPVATNKQTADGKRIFTNMRIGCLVLLAAQGTEDHSLSLSDLKLVPPAASQNLSLTFDVENHGNTHIFPLARLAIMDRQHKLAGKAESDMKRFLPGQKDSMVVNWSGSLPPGNYTGILSLVYAGNRVETRQVPFTVGTSLEPGQVSAAVATGKEN